MAEGQYGEQEGISWAFNWPEQSEQAYVVQLQRDKPDARSSYRDQVLFTWEHLDDRSVKPFDCPCPATWSMLKRAVMGGEKSKQTFLKDIYREFMKRPDMNDEQTRSRAESESLDLIDRFEALKDCPYCGKELPT